MWDWSNSRNRKTRPGVARRRARSRPYGENDEGLPARREDAGWEAPPEENRAPHTPPEPVNTPRKTPSSRQWRHRRQKSRPAEAADIDPDAFEGEERTEADAALSTATFAATNASSAGEELEEWEEATDMPPAGGGEASVSDPEMWEMLLDQMNLAGMPLEEVHLVRIDERWKAKMQKAFKRARRDFLKYVAYNHAPELSAAGVDENGLKRLKKGRSPENFNVHIKIPVDYGGTNDFSNLVLIQTHPYHEEIHRFLDRQLTQTGSGRRARRLFVPVPAGKVYVPAEGDASPGGKPMEDRSVYAGFLEKNIQDLSFRRRLGERN